MKLSTLLREAVSKSLEEKVVLINEMKEIQINISESMDLMRSLQAGLEAIMEAREEKSKVDPISVAMCAMKSGQKLNFNPAQENFIICGELVKPKMEDDLVPNPNNEALLESYQQGHCELGDSLLEQQLDLQNETSVVDTCLLLKAGNLDGKMRSITDLEIRSTIEGWHCKQGTETRESMLYKGECPKCHLQYASSNSLGDHRRVNGGECLKQVCKDNHNHDYIVRKFDTEDLVLDFIGNARESVDLCVVS